MSMLAAQAGSLLKSQGWMLSTAESCTGGGVAYAITEVAGSSVWFERGFVTYSNLSKQQLLGVREQTLSEHGAVSEMTVREMVAGALLHSVAQVALAVSGIAGPGGGTEDKPVGTVWFAWGIQKGETIARRYLLRGDRFAVRSEAVSIALQGLVDLLEKESGLA
jgi:nicotinamide-nucleotide amidase